MLTLSAVVLLTVFYMHSVLSQKVAANLRNELCHNHKTCGDCIAAGPSCTWCTDKDFSKKRFRCDLKTTHMSAKCKDIQDPQTRIVTGEKVPLRDYKSSASKDKDRDAVQLFPQSLKILVRPKETVTFDIDFRLARNYPVDLYYVMDLSYSMIKHKEKLAKLGRQIASRMASLTQNFMIGFGSFVDKVTMPYVNTLPRKLVDPCDDARLKCTGPYGFRHHLKLSPNATEFESRVRDAQMSGNLDSPEGGFDAIMQAAACKKVIGWRDVSRKLMIMSTDSGFHYAGSGKLGGIVTPNDMECHLNRYGKFMEYSMSTQLDYPSISQIRQVLQEKNIVLIFAVTEGQSDLYDKLRVFFRDSDVGKLKNDSSNIVELIAKVYSQISSKVELTASNTEIMSLNFTSACLGGQIKETSLCTGLHIGDQVNFTAHLTVPKCPEDPSQRKQRVLISPGGGLQERLVLDIEIVCECDCEQPNQVTLNSLHCSEGNGSLSCGICECNEGFAGRKCECKTGETNRELEFKCKKPNSTNLCEERGECICGQCFCTEKYDGDYCECDHYGCDRYDGKLCGGNGKCDCGVCVCNPGYSGTKCDCPDSKESCMANGKICNGFGECRCGKCECDLTKQYRGPKCEDCPVGCAGQCEPTRDCVQCYMFNTGKLGGDVCGTNCSHISITKVDDATQLRAGDVNFCRFQDDDDCWFKYSYGYDDVGRFEFIVHAQKTKECPKAVNILAIVLGVIGGIVAIGLALLLIWKILTTIHDRREFAKFEKERERAKWDTGENPIYKQATSNFKNPTYKRGEIS